MVKQLAAALGIVLALATATAASAAEIPVTSTAGVNLRAGPGLDYPIVVDLPAGAQMVLHGCVRGYTWCDVSWRGNRGWLSAGYMSTVYRNAPIAITAVAAARLGVAIVAFNAGYWHRYYLGRPWFRPWYRPWRYRWW